MVAPLGWSRQQPLSARTHLLGAVAVDLGDHVRRRAAPAGNDGLLHLKDAGQHPAREREREAARMHT